MSNFPLFAPFLRQNVFGSAVVCKASLTAAAQDGFPFSSPAAAAALLSNRESQTGNFLVLFGNDQLRSLCILFPLGMKG